MAQKDNKKNIHTISMLVANKPGVLVRIAMVFARRGYNIDSLVVSPSHTPRFSRMTITAQGNPETLEQIIKQANKLVDVIHASEHSEMDAVHSELALIKVKYTKTTKPIIAKLAKRFHARLLDDSDNLFIFEQAGSTEKLDEFEVLLKKYSVIEMVRTGKVVMVKGHEKT
ncbi:MAG: acetolactate synthase small subunit [Candidatus Omnitrophica bacterium]|nr:acetolactate synthase small subunit [Candidatus Omnitrophota bacterium]